MVSVRVRARVREIGFLIHVKQAILEHGFNISKRYQNRRLRQHIYVCVIRRCDPFTYYQLLNYEVLTEGRCTLSTTALLFSCTVNMVAHCWGY